MPETLPEGTVYRTAFAKIERGSIDPKKRTVSLSFSSDVPVERDGYREILDHSEGAVDLSRLNDGAPFLVDHNSGDQVGVVQKAWVSGGRGRAIVKIGKGKRASEIMEDIVDGIRTKISVGYNIVTQVYEQARDGLETVRATLWEPVELSTVAIPADSGVGIGRSKTMTQDTNTAGIENGVNQERDRVRGIQASVNSLIKRNGNHDDFAPLTERAINEGWDEAKFNRELIGVLSSRQSTFHAFTDHTGSTGTYGSRDLKNYSFCRAISGAANGKLDGLEGEMHQEYCRQHNTSTTGFFIPGEVLMQRSLTATGSTSGDELVEETVFPEFVDMLKKKTLALQLGARMLTNLQGEVKIPAKTSAGTASWETEVAEVAQTDMATAQISLVPKRLATSTSFSRLLMLQSTPTVEQLVRDDITSEFAIALDAAIFEGASGGPDGVTDDASGVVSIGSAGNPTHAEILSFETDIANANADLEGANLAFVVTPAVRANMRAAILDTGSGRYLWTDENTVIGYPGHVSNNVATSRIIFGNWREVIVGQWGGLEIIVDNLTSARKALINITASLFVDVDLRHDASFSINA